MAERTSNGPVASKLIFLSQLQEQQLNTKVRFLGCVLDYDEKAGVLLLEHKYSLSPSQDTTTKALVDMNMALETTTKSCLQDGSWINVIGYVQSIPRSTRRRASMSRPQVVAHAPPQVQAVLVWDAGAVKVDQYEQTIKQFLTLDSSK